MAEGRDALGTETKHRRLADTSRLLPVLGAFGFLVPLFWNNGPDAVGTAEGGMYLFGFWALLIFGALRLAGPLARQGARETRPDDAVEADDGSDGGPLGNIGPP